MSSSSSFSLFKLPLKKKKKYPSLSQSLSRVYSSHLGFLGWVKSTNKCLGFGPHLTPAKKTKLLLISTHSSLIWKCTQNFLRIFLFFLYGSERLVQNVGACLCSCAFEFISGQGTRHDNKDLASFVPQADCGCCSYYRPQDERTTCKWLYSSSYTSSLFVSLSRSLSLISSTLFYSFIHFVALLWIPPPPVYFYLCYSFSYSHWHTHTSSHTPVSNPYEMIPNAFGSQWEFPL